MKGVLFALVLAALPVDIQDVVGTFSGSWTPKGGVMDAVTVEIRQEEGKLVGRFRSPMEMPFTTASFDIKTGAVKLAATDSKSGKVYKLDGTLKGFEIKGTLTAGDTVGDLLLIKWTYVPR
jgi:hypothetical protein